MRDIRFRAWDKDKKCMAEVIELGLYSQNLTLHKADKRLTTSWSSVEVMQYTGLKDKNGKEGYHNDLVKFRDAIYQIIWGEFDAGFFLEHVSGIGRTSGIPIHNLHDCEVIGNIYENPELLEKK